MSILLFLTLTGYAAGLLLPLGVPGKPKVQSLLAHGSAAFAGCAGIALGMAGLLSAHPFTMSFLSTLPLLTYAIRLDALASFFLVMISFVSLAASIYALGYMTDFY